MEHYRKKNSISMLSEQPDKKKNSFSMLSGHSDKKK